MIKNVANIAVISILILLAGCQTVPESNQENAVSKKEIKIPSIGKVQSIQTGQSLYVQLEYLGSIIYKPAEAGSFTVPRALGIGNYQVNMSPANVFVKGKTKKGNQIICSIEKIASNHFNKLSVCITDEVSPGKLNKLIVNQSDMYTKDLILDNPPSFVESEIVFNPSGPTKREIVFEKYNNKNLTLQYKEYSDNKLTLNQPLIIPIESFPTTIDIKLARITFNSYSNGLLEYSVQKEMPATINGSEKVQCVTPGFNFIQTSTIQSCSNRKMTVFPLGYYETRY